VAGMVQMEIRGVGGATAQEILEGPVTQVSGDRIAGFYSPDVPPSHGRDVEAYEWGRLTSGTRTSSVWWILLPFTLINVAGWMFRPTADDQGRPDEPVRSSLWYGRLLVVMGGLAMTAVYVVWIVTLTVQIVVFGCVASPECADRWFMAPVAWFGSNQVWLIALGTGLAAVLVLGLFAFILRTQDNLEGFETDRTRRRYGVADSQRSTTSRLRRNTALENPAFWYKWAEHRRLFRWHLGLTMLLLGCGAGHAVARINWQAPPGNGWLAIAVVGAVIVALVWMLSGPERYREPVDGDDRGSSNAIGNRLGWMIGHIALALAGFGLAWIVTQGLEHSTAGRFGYLDAVRTLSGLLFLVAAGMVVVLCIRWWPHRSGGMSELRLSLLPGVSAALAIIVAGAGFVAIAHLLGRWLLGSTWVNDNGFDIVIIDILALSVVIVGVWSYVSYRRRRPKPRQDVVDDYFQERSVLSQRETDWVGGVAGARITSTLLGDADKTLTAVVAVMFVLMIAQAAIGDFRFEAGPDGAFAAPLFGIAGLRFLHSVAATVVVLYVFPGVQLIRANARSRDTRRQFGKVWDVLSFWPRRFHPLAAPCYAERAVPEFRNRIREHLAADRKVIVAAHSQGTVIAFASLVQLAAETQPLEIDVAGKGYGTFRDMVISEQASSPDPDQTGPLDVQPLLGVAVLTYGSPLSRLYGRFFSWHFGSEHRFQNLRDQLGVLHSTKQRAWRNLWRPSDYIGHEVFVPPGGVLDPVDDEADIRVLEAHQPLFPIDSHSNYEREQVLKDTIALFAAEI
jgi:hypothetical protein